MTFSQFKRPKEHAATAHTVPALVIKLQRLRLHHRLKLFNFIVAEFGGPLPPHLDETGFGINVIHLTHIQTVGIPEIDIWLLTYDYMSRVISGKTCGASYFLLSFSRIGLVPDGGATWLLPRLIGLARAREMALLAERLPAERALEWGLINRIVDDADLMVEAKGLANLLARGPAALPLTRKLFWDKTGYEAQLTREARAQERAGATADFEEGLAAFHQKREPKFRSE